MKNLCLILNNVSDAAVQNVFKVLRNKGVYENVKFVQQQNFWVGPSSVSILSSVCRLLSLIVLPLCSWVLKQLELAQLV